MPKPDNAPHIAIACGGTGGHLFPGIAVGEALLRQGARVVLLISNKAVDQAALRGASGMSIESLEAVGFRRLHPWPFVRGVYRSWRQVRRMFAERRPHAVLAMGGFTSVGPILEARRRGIPSFLHESNSIPGRANRWLAPWVDAVFVGFPEAKARLRGKLIEDVGTPVRGVIQARNRSETCQALGLDPQCPVLLVVGGSQGAQAINEAVMTALAEFRRELPSLQFIHLAGPRDAERVRGAYQREGRKASVHSFLDSMEQALGAADVALSRAGASSLAELAAARLPALLIPYPLAADNHQVQNARLFAEAGAAAWCSQNALTPEVLVRHVTDLLGDSVRVRVMREALAQRDRPEAARVIARCILRAVPSSCVPETTLQNGQRGCSASGESSGDGRPNQQRSALALAVHGRGGPA